MLLRRRPVLAPVVLVGVLALAACDPGISPLDPSLGAKWLTHDQQTVYGVTVDGGTTTVAKSSSNGDGRMVVWRLNDPVLGNQQSCATVSAAEQDLQQPGVALRIRPNTDTGKVKAITVTRNVWLVGFSIINVHVMDTSRADPVGPVVGSATLKGLMNDPNGAVYDVKPYPWRMCARAVGQTVTFKVWPTAEPEPAWTNPNYAGTVTISGAAWEGWPGFYAGHLEDSSGEIDFTNLSVAPL